eukprot:INCI13457.18.p1 GENE.INCI13457.18~~INCI13457.18.p1  ORF type:complete len:570 (+),score=98.80 INCI13457.18:381-2090(+)
MALSNSKTSFADAKTNGRPRRTSCPDVVIETDIGHDCDDIECLLVALKDHKHGRIRIRYISTVSGNNVQRAKVVQHLCASLGVSDIPIFPSLREKAARNGSPLDRCTPVWMYQRVGNRYVANQALREVSAVHPSIKLCQIHRPEDSVSGKQAILRRCHRARVLIIGPGVEAETFTELVGPAESPASIDADAILDADSGSSSPGHVAKKPRSNASHESKSNAIRRFIERIVWQGNFNDKASFNLGSDFEPAEVLQQWAADHGVLQYNIGKLVAYNTQLDRAAFQRLAAASQKRVAQRRGRSRRKSCSAHGIANSQGKCGYAFDLQAHLQLGVMEFRDAARNMFNCLNYGVSTPGAVAITKTAETFDEANVRHCSLKQLLTEDSLNVSWFDALEKVPPMYDLTAYLLLRDAHHPAILFKGTKLNTMAPAVRTEPIASAAASIPSGECEWYHVTAESATRFSVGSSRPDIRLPMDVYMQRVEAELQEAIECLVPSAACAVRASRKTSATAESFSPSISHDAAHSFTVPKTSPKPSLPVSLSQSGGGGAIDLPGNDVGALHMPHNIAVSVGLR